MNLGSKLSTIRARLVLGFVLAFVCMAVFGILSFQHFISIENKLHFLSQADALVNAALETRRYEKNYFLYHHEKDYNQALVYLSEFEKLLNQGAGHITEKIGKPGFAKLQAQAGAYRVSWERIHKTLSTAPQPGLLPEALADSVAELRKAGKGLIQWSEDLALGERESIKYLLQGYQPSLIAFLVFLALLGVWSVWLLSGRLVRPLRAMEDAAKVAGDGDFQPIPLADRTDEIGSLARAFNRMVTHLWDNSERTIQTEKLSALGTLTSGVAHELNNPLNNISTSSQILLEELGSEASDYHRELLKDTEEQVAKAKDIVSSLLEFARQREFELRPEDIAQVAAEALKLIRGEIPEQVSIEVKVPDGIEAEVDKAHLVQALINLIMNGIQAMPKGGALTIKAYTPPGAGQVLIEIADTGRGIAPEVLPRIFDPFFTTKDVGRGTGLGLSITYGIVERHQGQIDVESRPGDGARFLMRLPLKAVGS